MRRHFGSIHESLRICHCRILSRWVCCTFCSPSCNSVGNLSEMTPRRQWSMGFDPSTSWELKTAAIEVWQQSSDYSSNAVTKSSIFNPIPWLWRRLALLFEWTSQPAISSDKSVRKSSIWWCFFEQTWIRSVWSSKRAALISVHHKPMIYWGAGSFVKQ